MMLRIVIKVVFDKSNFNSFNSTFGGYYTSNIAKAPKLQEVKAFFKSQNICKTSTTLMFIFRSQELVNKNRCK